MARAALLALAVLWVAVGAFAAQAAARPAPELRLASSRPLTIQGLGFRPHERVQLAVEGTRSRRRPVVADAHGAFTATFAAVAVARCDRLTVVAIGTGGSRATLKRLPAPACMP
jgi:hypothetical protein